MFNILNFINILTFLTFISLHVNLTHQKCENLLQKNGQCTKCSSTKFLYRGDCYSKIRGCQQYFSDKICLSCQQGYVFNEGSCIKEAIFYKKQNIDIPPVKINIQGQLNFDDISNRIGESRKELFKQIDKYFKFKYNKNLTSCSISNVKYTETISGVVFTIHYRSKIIFYEAIAYINSKKDSNRDKHVLQLQFLQKKVLPTYTLEEINEGIIKKYQNILKSWFLSEIQNIKVNYFNFNYVNGKGEKYQSQIKKEPFEQIQELKKISNILDLQDALAYIFSIYPDLKQSSFQVKQSSNSINQLNEKNYCLLFDEIIQIKIKNTKETFNLLSYKNLQILKKQLTQKQNLVKDKEHNKQNKQISQFIVFQDFLDPILLQIWKKFTLNFPIYSTYSIYSIQRRKNDQDDSFKINAKHQNDQKFRDKKLQVLITYYAKGSIQIQELKINQNIVKFNQKNYKQQQDIENALQKIKQNGGQAARKYDYKNDDQFKQAYQFIIKNAQIVNVVPIMNVKKIEEQDHTEFEIFYSGKEKIKIRKNKSKLKNIRTDDKNFQVIYYFLDGKDLNTQHKLNSTKKQNVLQFIEGQNISFFSNYIVQSFKQNPNLSTIDVLTPKGSYQVKVSNSVKSFKMQSLINLFPENCFQFPQESAHLQQQFTNVDDFLKNNYGLNGAIFQLFQVQVNANQKIFRILYSDKSKRKLDVLVEKIYQNYIVTKSIILQQGYYVVNDQNQNIIQAQKMSKIYFSQLLNNCQIKIRKSNVTHNKIIYSCQNRSFEYIYSLKQKIGSLQMIFKEIQISSNFSFNNNFKIQLKDIIHDLKFLDVDQEVRRKFSQYLKNSQIIQVQKNQFSEGQIKVNYLYKILYLSNLDHYLCEASWVNGQIKVLNFYLVPFKVNLNCQILNEAQKQCIKCMEGYYLQFGSCYQQINDCEVQTGQVCVQCEQKAFLHDKRCFRKCEDVFKVRNKKRD